MQDFGAIQFIVPGEYLINCNNVADMPLTTFTLNGMDFDITGPELVIEVNKTYSTVQYCMHVGWWLCIL